jgi:N-acetylmuramoyl-L-alanine amidase
MSENLCIQWYPSPNYDHRLATAVIQFLIIHYTACDFKTALKYLTDPFSPHRVSAHYLIDEDGKTLQLVAEEHRAWHAGISSWRNYKGINEWSIGIELVNPGHRGDYHPFPEAQMRSLIQLCHQILKRHRILPEFVLGHADIAPDRKCDPGELFDWSRLAREGIGLYPSLNASSHASFHKNTGLSDYTDHVDLSYVQKLLADFGYTIDISGVMDPQTKAVLRAFQMHYSPFRVDQSLYPEMVFRLESLCHSVKVI